MINYIFDVDGTLTPPRQEIDPEFSRYFSAWIKGKNVSLVTGSDAEKTLQQLGPELWSNLVVYQCAGNEIYSNGSLIYRKELKQELIEHLVPFLEDCWRSSGYSFKLGKDGNHIEVRSGMVNFSVVGRSCSNLERKRYASWDSIVHEREKIREDILQKFPELEVNIGGEISLDIYPKGMDKSLVYKYLAKSKSQIYFFGDKTAPGGNDYPLVRALERSEQEHIIFSVKSYKETWDILKKI